MERPWIDRYAIPLAGQLILAALLIGGGLIYASGGGSARGLLVSQMLINAILVLGLQTYIGNTGVLSFGHMGFAAIAGYTVAVLAIDPTMKSILIPNAPLGLAEAHLNPMAATAVALAIVILVAVIVGLGLIRSVRHAGAVAATMITLALLFLVREAAANFVTLTAGNRSGLAFGPGSGLQGSSWIYIALVGSIALARFFRESKLGRLAQAARDDDLAARAMGVNPAIPHMVALLLSMVLITIGASLRVLSLGAMTPNFFFFNFTLLTLAMLIVGGRGSVTGSLAGVAVITVGNEVTRYLSSDAVSVAGLGWLLRPGLSELFLGGAMLGFMVLRPQGLLGDREIDDTLRRRLRERKPPPDGLPQITSEERGTLKVSGLSVQFGGFRALSDVSLEVSVGEVVGLIGPNGAGKTTLLNAVTGVVEAASGRWRLDDVDLTNRPPHEVARAGIARTFQNLRLFTSLSVRHNVLISGIVAERHRSKTDPVDIDALVAAVGLWDERENRAGEVNFGAARKVELIRAAALKPRILLLDEPTAGMWEAESVAMVNQVRHIAALIGAGVLVIDHDLHFITNICDRIYVLDQGRVIAHGTPDQVRSNPKVQAAYLGTEDF